MKRQWIEDHFHFVLQKEPPVHELVSVCSEFAALFFSQRGKAEGERGTSVIAPREFGQASEGGSELVATRGH